MSKEMIITSIYSEDFHSYKQLFLNLTSLLHIYKSLRQLEFEYSPSQCVIIFELWAMDLKNCYIY